ncbi:MAG: MucR family transcriptional regulator [Thermodesulfobacteriota bacterium]|nr:MucR family transcriptional regulator [Thermodesulfobacteriota bacterium]
MSQSLVEMAAGIVQSQCSSKNMATEEITNALQNTFKALHVLQSEEAGGAAGDTAGATDISPSKSIQKNKIICLECGQEFRMLSPKHLKSHDLTGREYREKYGFSLRQPLCAKSLSERRKKAGKERGLPENLRKVIAQRKKAAKAKTKAVKPALKAVTKKATAPKNKTVAGK